MQNFNELYTFIQVARAGSFTLAAERIGISKSALSHSVSNLENRLQVRLFNRNTRNISLTDVGLQLFQKIEPLFAHICDEIKELDNLQDNPKGTIRINSSDFASEMILYPKLRTLLQANPDIHIEIFSDNSLSDIIRQGFDFGVRLGETLHDEMIAVKISEPFQMVTAASPDYLAQYGTPTTILELEQHKTIAMRYSAEQNKTVEWEFKQGEQSVSFRPTPHFCYNLNKLLLQATLDGLGIAWLPKLSVEQALQGGRLVELFPEQAMRYEPFYLYYPSRKGHSQLFKMIVECLKV